ncbi:MAG: hypothetical protein ACI93R_000419 [Flavobacteriales bacterium]|jgi:hypothetical protein
MTMEKGMQDKKYNLTLIVLTTACIIFGGSSVHAENTEDPFYQLEQETGGCQVDLKSAQKELADLKNMVQHLPVLQNSVDLLQEQLGSLNATSRSRINALKSENTALKASASEQSNTNGNYAKLVIKFAELNGQLKASKEALLTLRSENQALGERSRAQQRDTLTAERSRKPTNNMRIYNNLEVSLQTCALEGSNINCIINLKSTKGDTEIRQHLKHTRVYSDTGNVYGLTSLTIGNSSTSRYDLKVKLIEGINTKAKLSFKDVATDTVSISKLEFAVHGKDVLEFRAIPLN